MKHSTLLAIFALLLFMSCAKKQSDTNPAEEKGVEKAESLGLKLSVQSSTFLKYSLVETFEHLKELEIRNIEIVPNHRLGGKWGDKVFDFNLSDEDQREIKALAKEFNIQIVGYGVYTTDKVEDWEKVFAFAKSMQMEYIVCEPKYEHLNIIDSLANQNQIRVGIHNSIQPSDYWNPEPLLEKLEAHTQWIGACADVGNWSRERFDPIEVLQKMKGKIQSVHFKDIDPKHDHDTESIYQKDVEWGKGILDTDSMLLELTRQGYKGYITIEYNEDNGNLMTSLKDCLFSYKIASYDLL